MSQPAPTPLEMRIYLHRAPLDSTFGMATVILEDEFGQRAAYSWLDAKAKFLDKIKQQAYDPSFDTECAIFVGIRVMFTGKLNTDSYPNFERVIIDNAIPYSQ